MTDQPEHEKRAGLHPCDCYGTLAHTMDGLCVNCRHKASWPDRNRALTEHARPAKHGAEADPPQIKKQGESGGQPGIDRALKMAEAFIGPWRD